MRALKLAHDALCRYLTSTMLILSVVNEDKQKVKQIMQPMGLLAWIVIGALAGWLAGMAMKSHGGVLIDILVGIVGAFIGGFLFSVFGFAGTTGFNVWSLFVAFSGAVVLLAVIRLLNIRRRRHIFN